MYLNPQYLLIVLLSTFPPWASADMNAITPQPAPNLIVIQCDDLGWDDLGIHGNPWVETPNIDAMATSSAQFSQFTVNPVCAPSRATFLTGRHFLRTGVSHVHGGKDFLHRNETTLADHLKDAGYATGMWGKWHSGTGEGYFPWQRGFDEAWMAQLYRHQNAHGLHNGEPVAFEKWADEVMVDYAIDFIERHRDQPFFVYLPTMTPHSPLEAPSRWVKHYEAKGLSTPLSSLWGMVSFLDEQLGRLNKYLSESGLLENTIIVFKSDNGPAIESSRLSDNDRELRKVTGLRGWKGDLYENAVRSPLFIQWHGSISPRDIDTPRDLVDLAPTLLELISAPPRKGSLPMDGSSFRELLLGEQENQTIYPIFNYSHRGWLTSGPPYSILGIPGEYRPVSAQRSELTFEEQSISIRQGNYKLILNPQYKRHPDSPEITLVDLSKDPREEQDLSLQKPEIKQQMLEELDAWWNEIHKTPHAFTAPKFKLVEGHNRIPANAPAKIQGKVFNTVIDLQGWSKKNEYALYQIKSDHAGKASIRLFWRNYQVTDNLWQISIAQTGAQATMKGQESITLAIPKGEFQLQLMLKESSELPIGSLRALEIEFYSKADDQ